MTTIHLLSIRTNVRAVPIAELSGAQVVAELRAFEASHHVTASNWRTAFRVHDTAYFRTSALYALQDAA